MAKKVTTSKGGNFISSDMFEQMAPLAITVDKDTTEWTYKHVDFAVNPHTNVGVLIKEIAISPLSLYSSFTSDDDSITFGLTDTNIFRTYSDISPLNPHIQWMDEWRVQKYGTPANQRYVWPNYIRADFRHRKGGGLLFHAASVYLLTFTLTSSSPGSDVSLYGRFFFEYVTLDDELYRELWENVNIPSI